jgi:selenocysteine-specific elongation factor
VEVEEVERGDILAQPGYFSTTYMIDARLNLLPDAPIPLRNRARVHLHLGPGEVLARVILLEADELHPGGSQLVQFRLESPGVAARGDRFVIRRYSPVHTLGGGIVLDAQPAKHRRHREEVHENLRGLEQDDPTRVLAHRLASAGFQAKTPRELASEMGLAPEDVESRLRELIDAGDAVAVPQAGQELYVGAEIWQDLLRRTQDALSAFHSSHPLQAGIRPNELRLQVAGAYDPDTFGRAVDHLLDVGALSANGPLVSLAGHRIRLSPQQEQLREQIGSRLREGKAAPPDLAELTAELGGNQAEVEAVVAAMQTMGEVTRLEDSLLFDPEALAGIETDLVGHLQSGGEISVSVFRDLVGTSRKYAVPLLNYFDGKGVTVRKGDVRELKA